MNTITSKDIVNAISTNTGWTYHESKAFYKGFIKTFGNSLERNKKITFTNFGTFVVKKKNHRMGRNPKTGQEAIITARNVVRFKPCIALKRKIQGTN